MDKVERKIFLKVAGIARNALQNMTFS